MPRSLLLGVDLPDAGAHPAAWRLSTAQPERLFDPARLVELVTTAERGGLDLVALPDAFAVQDGSPLGTGVRGRLDALLSASRVGPLTSTIGLLPTVTTTHTEPFHVAKAVQTLDWVSSGRGGWEVAVSRTQAEADLIGRKGAEDETELLAEAADVVEVARRLWDSWEDDAEIRDAATGRFVDRDRIHGVDFDGDRFSVHGASIVPRSPQGQPPVAVRVDSPASLQLAARYADLVRISAPDAARAAALRGDVQLAVAEAGRDPQEVAVLVDVVVHTGGSWDQLQAWTAHDPGTVTAVGDADTVADLLTAWGHAVDGFVVRPAALPTDLTALVDEVVPLLRERGLRPAPPSPRTFRDLLGLERPASRYALDTAAIGA